MSEDMSQGPEPGTREWRLQTGNYIDPEPDWDAGPPYVDHAHAVMYWDTASEADAGRERYPGYRHVGPEPETEAETARDDPDPWAFPEPEAESQAEASRSFRGRPKPNEILSRERHQPGREGPSDRRQPGSDPAPGRRV